MYIRIRLFRKYCPTKELILIPEFINLNSILISQNMIPDDFCISAID